MPPLRDGAYQTDPTLDKITGFVAVMVLLFAILVPIGAGLWRLAHWVWALFHPGAPPA